MPRYSVPGAGIGPGSGRPVEVPRHPGSARLTVLAPRGATITVTLRRKNNTFDLAEGGGVLVDDLVIDPDVEMYELANADPADVDVLLTQHD